MSRGKIYVIIIVLLQSLLQAQDTIQPSIPGTHALYGRVKILSVRGGVGIQKDAYAELGLAYHTLSYGCTGAASGGFYTAVEFMPQKNKNILGFKAGCEFNPYFLAAAIEAKYQTNFSEQDVVITPRLGFGLFGYAFIYYGYNISLNKSPFSRSGHHQLSCIVNLPVIKRNKIPNTMR